MNKGILRVVDERLLSFWCPGCKEYHEVNIDSRLNPNWSFNGNYEKPTFSPSIMVKSGHYVDGSKGDCWCSYKERFPDKEQPFKCEVCHSFITDGKIQYLNDCTHELAGTVVALTNKSE